MFLVGHAPFGILAARAVGATTPLAAFVVGMASHYVADFFPHGDEQIGEWTKKGNELLRLIIVFAIDAVLLIAILASFFYAGKLTIADFAAAAGSVTPDALWGFEKLLRRTMFGPHEKFHNRNHNFFHIAIPWRVGVAMQAVVVTALWFAVLTK